MRNATNRCVLAAAWVLSGCYIGTDGGTGAGLDGSGPPVEDPDDDAEETGDSGSSEGGGTDTDGEEACVAEGIGNQPLRRLTRAQYSNTIRDLIGIDSDVADTFPPDERIGSFYSNGVAPVTDLLVEQYMNAAEDLTAVAMEDPSSVLPCDPAMAGETECADEFIDTFGRRAFRRPLQDSERTQMRDLYANAESFDEGVRLVLHAFLQSPHLLYHVEAGVAPVDGEEIVALSGYEVASRLSYFLWESMPDDALLDAAEAGELTTPEGVRAQAERLLNSPRSEAGIASFHLQWLQVDNLEGVEKDVTLFPDFDEALALAMKAETAAFANYVVREGDGTLETLLTAPFSIVDDPALADLYGITIPAGHMAGDPLDLDATQRAGLFTHAGFLATNAHTNQSSPVHRGVTIRTNVLCQDLPPVPENVDNTPPDPAPDATTRERFAEHTQVAECAACHALIDGIGFGFEHYDAVGAYRDMEGELPVDASGDVIGVADIPEGEFDGAIELSQLLAGSDEVRQCVARQWFNYGLGRVPGEDDTCSSDELFERFRTANWNVRELVLAMVETAAFRYRRLDQEGA